MNRTTAYNGAQPNYADLPQGQGSSEQVVAGARYENYMQIEIEPFPLVA